MARKRAAVSKADAFQAVRAVGLALPDVESTTNYDGSPVLKVRGVFLAGLSTHQSAEPGSLIVRMDFEDRERVLEDAPDTYYVTEYHRPYPVVLVRLSRIDSEALRDLLAVSHRLALAKTRGRGQPTAASRAASAGRRCP